MTGDLTPMPGIDEPAKAAGEVAKLGQRLADLVEGGGQWISQVLGDFPSDLVGLLVGDRLKYRRMENLEDLEARRQDKLRSRGLDPRLLPQPSRNILLPIIEACVDEERQEIKDLWAALLASASDPARRKAFRLSFIAILQQMEPLDARLLKFAYERPDKEFISIAGDGSADEFFLRENGVSIDDAKVAVDNCELYRLLVKRGKAAAWVQYALSSVGRSFMSAVS